MIRTVVFLGILVCAGATTPLCRPGTITTNATVCTAIGQQIDNATLGDTCVNQIGCGGGCTSDPWTETCLTFTSGMSTWSDCLLSCAVDADCTVPGKCVAGSQAKCTTSGTKYCYYTGCSPCDTLAPTTAPTTVAPTIAPTPTRQAVVNLGAAANFTIFAAATITNTGNTIITGNAGLYPGTSVIGFPPGTVTGLQQYTNSVAQTARTALGMAFLDATGRSGQSPTPADLAGLRLYPGAYACPTSCEISAGTLTLDGLGDPNAVFIITTLDTFTMATATTVALAGAAQACNVFWAVGSSATLGPTAAFTGTLMADTSISVPAPGSPSVQYARLLAGAITTSGALTFASATLVSEPVCGTPGPTSGPTRIPTSVPTTLAPTLAPTPTGGGPQAAVDLGAAGNFTVFATSTITCTASAVITGDMGLTPGSSITGFPGSCTQSAGVQHIDDHAAQLALDYLVAAYEEASTCVGTDMSASNDLGGRTIYPGCYSFSSSFFINGNEVVTLNGQGNPNSVFIFHSVTTFFMGSGASVVLVNGAQACNVFWAIGSSASFSAGAGPFAGVMLADTSITISGGPPGVPQYTRLLAGINHSGAVTFINGDFFPPPPCSPSLSPTGTPTATPTAVPTAAPTTHAPTANPTIIPTMSPSQIPTAVPTTAPSTLTPTLHPTTLPTPTPTTTPTPTPTGIPTPSPSTAPTTLSPTVATAAPTFALAVVSNRLDATSMGIIFGIAGGVILLVAALAFFVSRRTTTAVNANGKQYTPVRSKAST